jgi:hypothetical protein
MMELLRLTSIQSASADSICRMIAQHLASRLGIRTEFVGNIRWPEREQLLDVGHIHVG